MISTGSPLNLTWYWSGSSDETRKNLDQTSKLLHLAHLLFSHKLAAAHWNEAYHITAQQASGLATCVPPNEKNQFVSEETSTPILKTVVSVSSHPSSVTTTATQL
jgi:hypothetical protein